MISRPNSSSHFLKRADATERNGGLRPTVGVDFKDGLVLVSVTELPDISLDDFMDMYLASTPAITEKTPTSALVGSLHARHAQAAIKVAGETNLLRMTVIKRGDFFYQIVCSCHESDSSKMLPKFEAIVSSFRPVEGREPQMYLNLESRDADLFGASIRNGVYSHAIEGLRLRAPDGCRLISSLELQQANPDAQIGISSGNDGFEQFWLFERIGKTEGVLESILDSTVDSLSATQESQRTVAVGGITATETEIGGMLSGEVELQGRLTMFWRENTIFRILSIWHSDDAKSAEQILERSYSEVEWTSEKERISMLVKLRLADRDPGNAVGTDFAMRRGTFHDFAGQFTLDIPDRFKFKTEPPSLISPEFSSPVRLTFSNLESGTSFELETISIDGVGADAHAKYHDSAMLLVTERQPTVIKELNGYKFRLSNYVERSEEGIDVPSIYATCEKNGKVIGITAYGTGKRNKVEYDLSKIIEGLERTTEGLGEQEYSDANCIDRRLGYRIDLTDGWEFERQPDHLYQGLSSFVIMKRASDRAWVNVICAPTISFRNVDLRRYLHEQEAAMKLRLSPSSFTIKPALIGGLDGQTITALGQTAARPGKRPFPIRFRAWQVVRDNTLFSVGVVGSRMMTDEDAQKIVGFLNFMD